MKQKVICLFMVVLLVVGAATPKKAYAVAGVDDAAVVIVCALLAAAGVTFATNDGVQDAVQGFLEDSAGRYDSTIERIASGYNVYGSVGAFKIPSMAMGGVRLLLEGLFDYFTVDENRQGAAVIPGGSYNLIDVHSLPSSQSFDGKTWNYAFFVPYSSDLFMASYGGDGELAGCSQNFRFDDLKSAWVCDFTESGYTSVRAVSASVSSPSDVCVYITFSASIKQSIGTISSWCYSYISSSWVTPSVCSSGKIFQLNNNVYYNPERLNSDFDIFSWEPAYGIDSERSIPYGLTFPQELTAPDVIDNFEQRVEESAGDLAIVVPVDGVVDNTLPYADAQDQYLVNVNELGDVTDSQVETNTWLQKLLVAVKSIPATLINLLEALLVKLFSPSDTVLQGGFDGLLGAFRDKTDYQTYMDLLSRFQSLSEPDLADLKVNWYGTEYTVVTWDFFRRTKATYSRWLRGFLYLFLLLFNFNNIYKLIRNGSLFNGSGHRGETGKGKGE